VVDRTRLETIIAEAEKGCCRDDSWRGRACQYHSGFEDGIDAAMGWLRLPPTGTEIDATTAAWLAHMGTRTPRERAYDAVAAFVAVLTGDADE